MSEIDQNLVLVQSIEVFISPQQFYNDGGGGGGGGTQSEVSVLSLWTDTGTLFVTFLGITRWLGGFIMLKSWANSHMRLTTDDWRIRSATLMSY